jgi:hypothetical protein
MIAARALGLDCGPLSGFDNAKVAEEFFGAGKECEGCDREFFPERHVWDTGPLGTQAAQSSPPLRGGLLASLSQGPTQ